METIVKLMGGFITVAVALWWLWRCHQEKTHDNGEDQ